METKPVRGFNWAPSHHPDRVNARYHRKNGVRYFFGCYDLKNNKLAGRIYARKRTSEFLKFLTWIRENHSGRLILILDNLITHNRPEVLDYCKANNMELSFTPTNASWLNPIERHFAALRAFVLCNTEYPNHRTQNRALHDYLRWRNKHPYDRRLLRLQKPYRYP